MGVDAGRHRLFSSRASFLTERFTLPVGVTTIVPSDELADLVT